MFGSQMLEVVHLVLTRSQVRNGGVGDGGKTGMIVEPF